MNTEDGFHKWSLPPCLRPNLGNKMSQLTRKYCIQLECDMQTGPPCIEDWGWEEMMGGFD